MSELSGKVWLQKRALLDIKCIVKEIANQIPKKPISEDQAVYRAVNIHLTLKDAAIIKVIDAYLDNWKPEDNV